MPLSETFKSLSSLGRRYYLLFAAGTLSDIGGFSTHAALILYVYNITDKNKAFMGLAALATLVPMLVSAPVGGVWAEKYNRRWVMIGNDIVRIPLVLLFMATGNVWAILGLQCLIASSTALFMPSRQAIIPELVRPEQIHLANSVNGGVLAIVHILGPITGATIFGMTGTLKWIVLLDACTYFGSALLLSGLNYKPGKRLKSSASRMMRDITDGLRYVRRKKDFFYLFILLLSADSAIGLLLPLMRPFIDEALHGTDANYGHLLGAFGLGGIVGPVIGFWAGRRFGLGRTLTVNFVMEGFLIVVWSRVTNIYASAAILFVWGVNVFILIPCYMSYVHSYAKKEYMGRTFSLFDQTTYGAQILGALVVVVVGNALPTQNLLTTAGIVYLIVIASTLRSPGARLMRSRRGQATAAESHSAAPRMEDLPGAQASGEAVETARPSEEEA